MNPNINTLSDSNNNNDSGPASSAISMYTEKAKQAIVEMPLFVKGLPILIFCLYILSCFFSQISFYMSNMLGYTIFKFQLWRIVTAIIIMTRIFNILFALLFWIPEAIKIERALGTLGYVFYFTINGIIIQLFYSILLIPLMILFGEKLLTIGYNETSGYVECNGIWPIIMMDITVVCLTNPNNLISFFCLPWSLKAKYYPLILLAFFTLLNGIQFDIIVGTIYGITYIYLLKNKLNVSEAVISKCEESSAFKWMKKFKGFIPLAAAIGFNNLGMEYQTTNNQQSNQQQSDFINLNQQNQGFNFFQGKGVVVGGNA